MIPASVDRAVVEILAAGATLGTGFLATADGLILTAKHVVGALPRVQVCFLTGGPYDADVVEVGAGTDDWALVRTPTIPVTVTPVPLDRIGNVANDVTWYSVGHTRLRFGQRGNFSGRVRGTVPTLDLRCDELAGQDYVAAKGLSGGPCLVDGTAVGIIIDVVYSNVDGKVVGGDLIALSLDTIAPTKVPALALGGGPRLPWQEVFSGALRGLADEKLLIAADKARLANPVLGPALPRQIARRMISQGIESTAAVLAQLQASIRAEEIDEVMRAAETLWVPDAAAECLRVALETRQPGTIATDADWVVKHHLGRAYTSRELGAVPWPFAVVAPGPAEPWLDVVVDETFGELAELFEIIERTQPRPLLTAVQRATVKSDLAARAQGEPVTAFIASHPRKDIVDTLRAELPELTIVFMSRAQPSARPSQSVPVSLASIAPAPTPDDETRASQERRRARARLSKRP